MAENSEESLRPKKEWDQVWEKTKFPKYLNKASSFGLLFDRLIKKHLPKGGKLLEIGCAGGRYLVYFAREFDCKVYGLDYSVDGCELAKKNLERSQVDGKVICGDLFNCEDLERESFDVVFSGGFIEHFDDSDEVIRKHIEYLKPGGTVIIEVPNMLGLHGYVFKIFNPRSYSEHKSISSGDVENILIKNGIEIQANEFVGSLMLESGGKPAFIQPVFYLVNKFFYFLLRLLNFYFNSQKISPYFVVIGKKPL